MKNKAQGENHTLSCLPWYFSFIALITIRHVMYLVDDVITHFPYRHLECIFPEHWDFFLDLFFNPSMLGAEYICVESVNK